MNKFRKHRLVVASMGLASAIIRLVTKLLDLLDVTSNYPKNSDGETLGYTV